MVFLYGFRLNHTLEDRNALAEHLLYQDIRLSDE